MNSEFRVRQVWLPLKIDYTGEYFARNLHRIIDKRVKFVQGPKEPVDAEIVGVFSELPSAFARYQERLKQKYRLISGHAYIHGGLNRDVSVKYDMRNPPRTSNYSKRIWFSGENIRPPFGFDYDTTISFDLDSYRNSNIYGPISYLLLTESASWTDPLLGIPIMVEELANTRVLSPSLQKEKFACAFVGNDHNVRFRFIEELRRFGEVDVFGTAVGRPVRNKSTTATPYKFVICFENDLYPGYITEKLVHAYASGAVPLYWGNIENDSVFNKKAFMNLNDYESIESFAHAVGHLSQEDYEKMYSEPLILDMKPVQKMWELMKIAFTSVKTT